MKQIIKVLHLGYSDDYGGASVAMTRLNEALSLIDGIDSKITDKDKVKIVLALAGG